VRGHVIVFILSAGDAKNEVPITNLAKIEFPGSKEKTKEKDKPKCN
jgi:hypothetical protein